MQKLTLENQLNINTETIAFHFHGNNFEEHSHNYFEIMLITESSGMHTLNGKTFKLKAQEACIIKPTDKHSLSCPQNKESRHLNIMISIPQFRLLCNAIDVYLFTKLENIEYPQNTIKLSQHDFNKILNFAYKYQSLSTLHSAKKSGILNCLTLSLLQEFYLSTTDVIEQIPSWLKTFINNLSSIEYLEMKPSEVFKKIPYSYSNFEKLFKKYIGKSFVSYFNDNKIEYAKSLLKTTDFSVITIANKICMHSLGHFYNVFKEKTGQTPTQYRKQHKIIPY